MAPTIENILSYPELMQLDEKEAMAFYMGKNMMPMVKDYLVNVLVPLKIIYEGHFLLIGGMCHMCDGPLKDEMMAHIGRNYETVPMYVKLLDEDMSVLSVKQLREAEDFGVQNMYDKNVEFGLANSIMLDTVTTKGLQNLLEVGYRNLDNSIMRKGLSSLPDSGPLDISLSSYMRQNNSHSF